MIGQPTLISVSTIGALRLLRYCCGLEQMTITEGIRSYELMASYYHLAGKPRLPELRFGAESSDDSLIDPERMSPKERLDWYKGNSERDAHAKEQDLRIPIDLLDHLLGAAFAELRLRESCGSKTH